MPGRSMLRWDQQETGKPAELEGTLVVKSRGLCAQETWDLNPGPTTDEPCDLGHVL